MMLVWNALKVCLYSLRGFCYGFLLSSAIVGCESGAIRFVGGTVAWEGRVEVCKSELWGTVCDDLWDTDDANVACGQAGFSGLSKFSNPRDAWREL